MVTNQAYNFLKTCLGILWLLDATLQLQPLMFTKLFPEEVVLPAFESLPFKAFFIGTLYPLILSHVFVFNLFVFCVQALLGFLVIVYHKSALTLSCAWSFLVWVFGEGFGGIFVTPPSVLLGFPGAALLYFWLSLILIFWERCPQLRCFAGIFLLACSFLQFDSVMFTQNFQSAVFSGDALPKELVPSIEFVKVFASSYPVLMNLLEILLNFISSLLIIKKRGFVVVISYLVFVWYFAQNLGGILTGIGTDANSAPLIALLSYASYKSERVFELRANWLKVSTHASTLFAFLKHFKSFRVSIFT
jgi:hypothetical protein